MWWNMRITQTLTYGLAIFSNISYNHDLTNVCSVFRCLNMWDLAPYKSNPIVGGKTKTLFMSSHVPRNVKCSCRWYLNSFILYNFDTKYSMFQDMKVLNMTSYIIRKNWYLISFLPLSMNICSKFKHILTEVVMSCFVSSKTEIKNRAKKNIFQFMKNILNFCHLEHNSH